MTNKNNLKERVVAWLDPKQIETMEMIIANENMKNHSEFVAQAVDFYVGYLNSKDSTSFLAENLQAVLKGTMQTTENRMANNLFRMSVEMSMMMHILAKGLEVSEESLSVLRSRCIKEVKSSKGRVPFEEIKGGE